MKIRNIATDQGLVNGAMGFVQLIEYENNEQVRIFFFRFVARSIARMFYSDDHDAIGIEKISQDSENDAIYRTQFSADAWACTIHKVEGNKIVTKLLLLLAVLFLLQDKIYQELKH